MRKIIKEKINYFSREEKLLWTISILMIMISFRLFDGGNILTLAASLIGATSLILNAKGNPFGQLLMIVFSVIYGYISYTFSYYGEMLTYLGMTAPMALFALISWLQNPYQGNHSEVKVNRLTWKEWGLMLFLTILVTIFFYFVLLFFRTANLIPSTLSVTTSFIAVYLTFRRSPYFALAYAANDVVLIVLWILASLEDISYLSVMVCFLMFLFNDVYGYINWRRIQYRQEKKSTAV